MTENNDEIILRPLPKTFASRSDYPHLDPAHFWHRPAGSDQWRGPFVSMDELRGVRYPSPAEEIRDAAAPEQLSEDDVQAVYDIWLEAEDFSIPAALAAWRSRAA